MFGENHPVVEFLSDLGKLMLMLFAGLEVDLALFRRQRNRAISFGLVTTVVPLLLGTVAGLGLGYAAIPALVVGSLLASHTLLALPIIDQLGVRRLEPVAVTVGATVLSDMLSLVVFAICVPAYEGDLSILALAAQIIEIVAFVALILFGLARVASYALQRVTEEDAQFVLILALMAVTGALARLINLPGIVGAFLPGLALNEALHEKATKEKLEFVGKSFFIPIFFIVIGFLIDPLDFAHSVVDHFPTVAAILVALIAGKWIAAEASGRAFSYSTAARRTMWSLTLTLPQVAATLAATLVATSWRSVIAFPPPTLLGGPGSRPSHRGGPRVNRPKSQSPGTTQRAQRNPMKLTELDGAKLAATATTPANEPSTQLPPRNNAPGSKLLLAPTDLPKQLKSLPRDPRRGHPVGAVTRQIRPVRHPLVHVPHHVEDAPARPAARSAARVHAVADG